MRILLTALILAASPTVARAKDNLAEFVPGQISHPICGIDPTFDSAPKFPPPPPFATCRTLAAGFSIAESYPDKGVDALSKLIVALGDGSNWETRFAPLGGAPLTCRPALPLGIGPKAAPEPICTVAIVQSYLATYNQQKDVVEFRKLERRVQALDLTDADAVDKILQAAAVVRAGGSSVTFGDVAELLE